MCGFHVCVRVWVHAGICGPLIRECGWAKLLFLRSRFKDRDIEGLFLGRERVGFLHKTWLARRQTNQVEEDATRGICKQ